MLVGGLTVAACFLGMAVVSAGSDTLVMVAGAVISVALAGLIVWALDVPLIDFVRIAFLATFFIKSDMSIFKIDEMEDPSGLNISATFILGVILFVYDRMHDEGHERVFPPLFTWLFTGLAACSIAAVLFAGTELLGVYSILSLLTSILIAYVTASHFGRKDRISYLITGLAIGVLATGLVALSQYVIQWPLDLSYFGTGTPEEQAGTQSEELSRVPAFLRTPNGMAWVTSTLVPLVLAPVVCRVKSITSWQKVLFTLAGLFGALAVTLSLARGSWIGLVVAIVLLIGAGWIGLPAFEKRRYFLSAAAGVLLLGLFLAPLSQRIYDRLTEDDKGSVSIRAPLMENALRMIEANPLVGVGLNNYRYTMTKYDETGIFVSQAFANPVHNVFAHVTTEIGIPGGIIFCLLLLAAFSESVRAMLTKNRVLFALGLGAAVSLVVFAISGMKEPATLGSVRPPMRTCFLLLGTILAISRVRRTYERGKKDLYQQ